MNFFTGAVKGNENMLSLKKKKIIKNYVAA